MRISTLQQFNNSVALMQKGQNEIARLQEKISSGKELLTPSDDPVGAAQVVKLERELARYDKFADNIAVTRRRLELEESVLDQFNTALDRVRELTLQAGSGTYNDNDRAAMAAELRQLKSHMLGLMNTKDVQGEYLFAGHQGLTQPFVENADGSVSYQGDSGARFIQVGPDLQVQSTDGGRDIFEVIEGDTTVQLLGDAADTSVVNVTVLDPESDDFRTFSQQWGDVTLSITNILSGPPDTYDYALLDASGNPVTDSDGNPIAGTATPGTPVELPDTGLSIDYTGAVPAADPGPVTLRAVTPKHNVLTTIDTLADLLETPVDGSAQQALLSEGVAKALDEMNEAREGVLGTITRLGARLSTLEEVESNNADARLFTETTLSQLRDLDYAAAVSKFRIQELALQAAQTTFGRVANLSLFNVL